MLKEIPSEPVVEEEVVPEAPAAPKPEGATEEDGEGDGGEDGAGNWFTFCFWSVWILFC